MSKQYILEIAIFTVKPAFIEELPSIRKDLSKSLKAFDGLIDLETYSPIDNSRVFADIAKWDSLENAKAVAEAFESGDERFLPYIEALEDVKFMGHFKPD